MNRYKNKCEWFNEELSSKLYLPNLNDEKEMSNNFNKSYFNKKTNHVFNFKKKNNEYEFQKKNQKKFLLLNLNKIQKEKINKWFSLCLFAPAARCRRAWDSVREKRGTRLPMAAGDGGRRRERRDFR